MSDTYNMGPTIPALFKAYEERYQKLCEKYVRLERENEALRKKLSYYEAITTGAEHKAIDAAIKEQAK